MMEDDSKKLFRQVSASLSTGLLWMIINMTGGIYFGWLFFEDKPSTGNYIFYIIMIVSLAWLIRFNIKVWK